MPKIFLVLSLLLLIDVSWSLTDTKNALPGQFPSYASIVIKLPGVREVPVCGGVIINENYILTSGQCDCVGLQPVIGDIKVKVGVQYRLDESKNVQIHEVSKVIINKKLRNERLFLQIKKYDIALLKLSSPIIFNKRVQPALLPLPNSIPTGKANIVGLGATSVILVFIPQYPNQLQQAEVRLINEQDCNRILKGYTSDNSKLLDKQLCTVPVNNVATACVGDSGDPLIQQQDGKAVVIGTLTWAPYPCRQSNAPIIYTSISEYIDWITEQIQEN